MSDDDIQMFPLMCDAECGRHIGWSDVEELFPAVILCKECMDNPGQIAQRLGIEEPS